jgi:hypothetical protein
MVRSPTTRHGRRRPTIHVFLLFSPVLLRREKQKLVDGRPSPTMTEREEESWAVGGGAEKENCPVSSLRDSPADPNFK